jgi:hypothetical protein
MEFPEKCPKGTKKFLNETYFWKLAADLDK